jgi:hypothetical protein
MNLAAATDRRHRQRIAERYIDTTQVNLALLG